MSTIDIWQQVTGGASEMENLDIRLMAKDRGVCFADIASVLGVHRCSVSRMMRKELSPKQREKILFAIDQLSGEGKRQ